MATNLKIKKTYLTDREVERLNSIKEQLGFKTESRTVAYLINMFFMWDKEIIDFNADM